MTPPIRRVTAIACALAIAACSQPDPAPPQPHEQAASTPASDGPPPLLSELEKGETGARNVLIEWARDLERGDYDGAYALWLDGERSGMTRAEHAAYWDRFEEITVAVPTRRIEGAAGSLYYEAPATIAGTLRDGAPYRMEGMVVLRRANDVEGAPPAQLRWHLEKVDLAPVE